MKLNFNFIIRCRRRLLIQAFLRLEYSVWHSDGHCHVNRGGPQKTAWIPFQVAALALAHTLKCVFPKLFEGVTSRNGKIARQEPSESSWSIPQLDRSKIMRGKGPL